MARPPRKALICFDLGGVLVRIRRSWQECAHGAGVETALPPNEIYDLMDFPLFDAYQIGSLGTVEYLDELGSYLGVKQRDAQKVHMAILQEMYEGTEELVKELQANELDTGCLSNTNTLHWDEMVDSGRFPNVANLHYKFTSHHFRLLKPDAAIFRLFDRESGYDGEHIVYFDDHRLNVEAAAKHGWNAFLIDHEGSPAEQIRSVLRELELLPST